MNTQKNTNSFAKVKKSSGVLLLLLLATVLLSGCQNVNTPESNYDSTALITPPATVVEVAEGECVAHSETIEKLWRGEYTPADVTNEAAILALIAATEKDLKVALTTANNDGCSVTDLGLPSATTQQLLKIQGNIAQMDVTTQNKLETVAALGRLVAQDGIYPADLIIQIATAGAAGLQLVGPDDIVHEPGLVGVWSTSREATYVAYSLSGTCWVLHDRLQPTNQYSKLEGGCSGQMIQEFGTQGGNSWQNATSLTQQS